MCTTIQQLSYWKVRLRRNREWSLTKAATQENLTNKYINIHLVFFVVINKNVVIQLEPWSGPIKFELLFITVRIRSTA